MAERKDLLTAKTNTAIGLMLAGIGLLLLAPESRGLFRTVPGRTCATLAVAQPKTSMTGKAAHRAQPLAVAVGFDLVVMGKANFTI